MVSLIKKVKHTLDSLFWNFIIVGVALFLLGALIVVDESTLVLRVVIGAVVILLAYSFFYAAYKAWSVKKEIDRLD